MNHMNYEEACEMLRKVGFTASEMDRLSELRRNYIEKKIGQTPADHPQSNFASWFGRAMRKMRTICQHLADFEGVFWMHDYLP